MVKIHKRSMKLNYWLRFGLLIGLFTNLTSSYQVLIDFPADARWNQTASSVTGDDSTVQDNTHLNQPKGIDLYSNDTLVISDTVNNRLIAFEEGVLSGTVILNSSIVCNGVNGNVQDVFVAVDNSIYVSCTNSFIERWSQDGYRSIVAGVGGQGSGLNQLLEPRGIYVDSSFNLYVADNGNTRVIKWNLNDTKGQVLIDTSIVPQLRGPYELFLDETLMTLYISEGVGSGRIIKQFLTNGSISIFNGNFDNPTGMIIDENRRVYIVESNQHRVLRFEPDGSNYSCIAACSLSSGTSASQLNQPSDLRFDHQGNLLVSDTNNHRIQKFVLNTNFPSSSGSISSITMDDSLSNGTTTATNFTSTLGSSGMISSCAKWSVNGITILGDPNGASGNVLPYLFYPRGLVIDKNNQIFVADSGNGKVFRMKSNSSIESIAGYKLIHPTDIVFDKNEQIFVLESGRQRVVLFPTNAINSTSNVTVGWGHGNGSATDQLAWYTDYTYAGLTIDINSMSLDVSDMDNHRVVMWLPNATNGTVVGGVSGVKDNDLNHLSSPRGILLDQNGLLWISDFDNNRIVTSINGSPLTVQIINVRGPSGFTFDSSGNVYIVETKQHQVSRWRPDLNRTDCILACNNGTNGSASNQFSWPSRIQIDFDGNLIVSDTANHRIQKFALVDNSPCQTTTLSSFSTDGPSTRHSQSTQNNQQIPTSLFPLTTTSGSKTETSIVKHSVPHFSTTTVQRSKRTTKDLDVQDTNSIFNSPLTTTEQVRIKTSTPDFDGLIESTLQMSSNITLTETKNPLHTISVTVTQSSVFLPSNNCPNDSIGVQCQYSMDPCVFENPCLNNGTCQRDVQLGYQCKCLPGYEGDQCQFDRTLCRTKCFGRGNCSEKENGTDFECQCETGWTGKHCERMIDNCANVICQNKGVCVNLYNNYSCSCLEPYFSGRYCQVLSTQFKIHDAISTSVGYVGWISLGTLIGFIVIMDVLRYCFGIDPVQPERQRIKNEKLNKTKIVIQFKPVYKQTTTSTQSNHKRNIDTQKQTV